MFGEIEVYADYRSEVKIDAEEALSKIQTRLFGYDTWINECEGKYYLRREIGLGQHSTYETIKEVSAEENKMFESIQLIKRKLSDLKEQEKRERFINTISADISTKEKIKGLLNGEQ